MTRYRERVKNTKSIARPLLFLNHTGQRSGAERVLLSLVDRAVQQGHEVAVACPEGPLAEGLPQEVRHVEIPFLGLTGQTGVRRLGAVLALGIRFISAGIRVRRELQRDPEALVLVNSLIATPLLRLLKIRGTWLVHDTLAKAEQKVVAKLGRSQIRWAVAVSERTAGPVREAGIPVVVRYNGIQLPVPDLRRETRHPIVLGALSTLAPWKGHRVLLEAVARVPNVSLEIAGRAFPWDRDYETALRERAERPDLKGRVHFIGFRKPFEALSRWDGLVSCSELPEAGPISVLEAMAAGVPVLANGHISYGDGKICHLVEADNSADTLVEGIHQLINESEENRRARTDLGRELVLRRHDLNRTEPAMLSALIKTPTELEGATPHGTGENLVSVIRPPRKWLGRTNESGIKIWGTENGDQRSREDSSSSAGCGRN